MRISQQLAFIVSAWLMVDGSMAFAQVEAGKIPRVQTDLTQTMRNGQQSSQQFVQQFQNAELGTLTGDLKSSLFEDIDPTEYEVTLQMVNLTRLPVDVRVHPELAHYNLDSGHVLVQPQKNTSIKTDEGTIDIGEGAVVAVLKTDTGVTILDLFDERRGDVKVHAGSEEIIMSPGMQITLTKHPTKELKEIHPAKFVGHRNLKHMKADDGTRVFMADYSMFAAVAGMKRIRDLAHSKKKEDRKVFQKIMKTAASITLLHGLHGKFSLL